MKTKRLLSALLAILMLAGVCLTGIYVSAEEELPFTDVKKNWSYDAIKYVYETGLMNGTGNGTTFSPNDNLTRGMVVTVLYRHAGSPAADFKNVFLDVAAGKYYSVAAVWAYENGIVNGTGTDEWGDPYFSPDNKITRQELATMFARYADFKHVDTTKGLADINNYPDNTKVAGWATDAVKWAVGVGLITGKGNGDKSTLSPKDNASRAEFATIISRYDEFAPDFSYLLAYEAPVLKNSYTEPEYPLVTDADIYVAVDGDDSNPGTLDKPLRTFEAAVKKISEVQKNGERKVAFMGGDYGITSVTMDSADSGTAESPITYCAYGDGPVYFTNGIHIPRTEFKPLDESDKLDRFNSAEISNIKKIDLSSLTGGDMITDASTLFTNGQFCTLARTPNKEGLADAYYLGCSNFVLLPTSDLTYEELIHHTNTDYTAEETDAHLYQDRIQLTRIVKDKLDSYSSLKNVQLCGYISKVWHQDIFTITEYDKNTGIAIYDGRPPWGFYALVGGQTKIYINNVSEELDFEGEYWIDRETNTLYVYAPTEDYYIATAGTFVKAEDTDNISFVNLNFRCTTAEPFMLTDCDNVTVDRCNISYVAGNDGFRTSRCLDLTVKNSTFEYFSGYGIAIYGCGAGARSDYDYMALESQNIVIENNLFHDIALVDIHSDVAAVKFLDYVIGARIAHNEFYNSSRHAISFGRSSGDVTIEYNYIHHCMVNSADGGAIHNGRGMVGPVNIIRYNLFENITPELPGGTMGIYLDDMENDTEIYGNVFYNVSTAILTNGGRDHNIHDNVMIDSNPVTINYSTDRILEIFQNNDTEYTSQYTSLLPKEDSPYYSIWKEKCASNYKIDLDPANVGKPNSVFTPNCTVVNNVSIGNEFSVYSESMAVGTYNNNNVYKYTENPIFVDPTHGDYSIREGSGFADNHFDKIGRY